MMKGTFKMMDHKVLQLDDSFNETKICDQLPMHRIWEMN